MLLYSLSARLWRGWWSLCLVLCLPAALSACGGGDSMAGMAAAPSEAQGRVEAAEVPSVLAADAGALPDDVSAAQTTIDLQMDPAS